MSDHTLHRRDFLLAATAAAAAGVLLPRRAEAAAATQSTATASRLRIEAMDYRGVRLRDSRWQQQHQAARDFYFGVSDDDILCGYRSAASMAAPGKPLGGWCAQNSNTVLGQWLSGMARMSHATGDTALRDKAITLANEWAKTIGPDGDCRMRH
ncbi:MAG TPA: beta-L-arabinofuranosidase domain-containing protein, partial [Tepidisphaeraceae bacterium]